eukprot:CAMPEP_0113889398 /NCGR_PEP_ID=MMETSP0780_2-20120614/13463_1 /TAXON_ID=652834 /ORGANISM="Palpitomonas bilix" /LENGTH=354 /DNA_ID=CAMNT_0000878469 /DNA_START=188 /DNA_END=1252 /DNA_ORIENTATION=+ /assembly_acc=CAM_ASM_000599
MSEEHLITSKFNKLFSSLYSVVSTVADLAGVKMEAKRGRLELRRALKAFGQQQSEMMTCLKKTSDAVERQTRVAKMNTTVTHQDFVIQDAITHLAESSTLFSTMLELAGGKAVAAERKEESEVGRRRSMGASNASKPNPDHVPSTVTVGEERRRSVEAVNGLATPRLAVDDILSSARMMGVMTGQIGGGGGGDKMKERNDTAVEEEDEYEEKPAPSLADLARSALHTTTAMADAGRAKKELEEEKGGEGAESREMKRKAEAEAGSEKVAKKARVEEGRSSKPSSDGLVEDNLILLLKPLPKGVAFHPSHLPPPPEGWHSGIPVVLDWRKDGEEEKGEEVDSEVEDVMVDDDFFQ